MSNGGPGFSNIASDSLWRGRLAPALKDHDMLAIDHRGIGASAATDCPALQHVQGNQLDAARACGESLGAASDRYGSGDVADDVDDVRAALGIEKIDYYGVSYGPVDVRAYAYRHPDHLHAAVLDSPDFSSDDAFFRTLPGAMAKITVRVCERSPACSAGEKHPDQDAGGARRAGALASGDRHRLRRRRQGPSRQGRRDRPAQHPLRRLLRGPRVPQPGRAVRRRARARRGRHDAAAALGGGEQRAH